MARAAESPTESAVPPESMRRAQAYVEKYFEHVFVLLTLVATALINYFIPNKFAFLNFYFLPVILAGYYLGRRKAVLGAFFCVLVVSLYVILFPEWFQLRPSSLDIPVRLSTWGGFLILAAAVVGTLRDRLAEKVSAAQALTDELRQKQEELVKANTSLEHSKRSVEVLKRKVEDTLYATMDPIVANLIIEDRLRNEKRNVSVLFSDLVGFTSYSEEHPPEVVVRELNRYLRDAEPILLAYHGHIDKYMGDGIMCEFGAPIDVETHQLLAVVAGMKLQERMAKRDYPWELRVGVASGPMITGVIGSKRQTYTAIGDVVNIAARLQQNCAPGHVLVDGPTYESVKRFVEACKKRHLPGSDIADREKERQLEALHLALADGPAGAELYFRIGRIHLELNDLDDALYYFEQALKLDPDNLQFKLAYVEAGLKARESERIGVKGKRRRIEAYEIKRLKDPLENRDKFQRAFIDEFGAAADLIQIPDGVVLPVEALDGTIGHGRAVAVVAYALASQFRLSEREKLDILRAGFVADIGKEISPPHLLNRTGRLTGSELDTVRGHPAESVRILRKMGYENEAMLTYVLHSHEYFNGGGYPDGLQGEGIPLGSRILAVADAYDALTSWRPYREAWERSAALDEIARDGTNRPYDPKVVDALIRIIA